MFLRRNHQSRILSLAVEKDVIQSDNECSTEHKKIDGNARKNGKKCQKWWLPPGVYH